MAKRSNSLSLSLSLSFSLQICFSFVEFFLLIQPLFFLSLMILFVIVDFKKVKLSLSLSLPNFVSLLVNFFYCFNLFFFPLMILFVIVDLIVTSHLFLFLTNLYRLLCIFRYFDIPILDCIFLFILLV